MTRETSPLPPGQHAVDGFPRFGTHLHRPPPPVPTDPAIEIAGAVAEPLTVPLSELAALPRTQIEADLHCVAGWSATGLRWEGVAFATFFRDVVAPSARPDPGVAFVGFGGLDGYRSVARLEDAMADDVLIAEHLDGRPLDGDHGAPARLVSPSQYGYISTKHLCRIELFADQPEDPFATATGAARTGLRLLGFNRHTRARVWQEERGGYLPNVVARPVYRLLIPPIRRLSAHHRSGGGPDG